MHQNKQAVSPVVVGGIGGSGTRLVAYILQGIGYNIGHDLNPALDNLSFTYLFRHNSITNLCSQEFKEILEFFTNQLRGIPQDPEKINRLLAKAFKFQNKMNANWKEDRSSKLKTNRPLISKNWGWKEPNTHIVLDKLIKTLPSMKYIYVYRNGLDMAFSKNQNQLKNWGHLFFGENFDLSPKYSLKFWCRSHQRISALANGLEDSFMFLNFDELCHSPNATLNSFLDFLKMKENLNHQELLKLINPPNTFNRFQKEDISLFDKEDLEFVENAGFPVA